MQQISSSNRIVRRHWPIQCIISLRVAILCYHPFGIVTLSSFSFEALLVSIYKMNNFSLATNKYKQFCWVYLLDRIINNTFLFLIFSFQIVIFSMSNAQWPLPNGLSLFWLDLVTDGTFSLKLSSILAPRCFGQKWFFNFYFSIFRREKNLFFLGPV